MPAAKRPQSRSQAKRARRPSLGWRLLALTGAGLGAGARTIGRHPALSGGLAAFGMLFAGVAGNAFYGQSGTHPNPMLATRGDIAGRVRQAAASPAASQVMPVPLVREVQTALARGGRYSAAVDGRPGPATEAAIRSFQEANGLPQDGVATPTLLAQLRQVLAQAPNPKPRPNDVASLDERMVTGSVPDNSTDLPEDEVAKAIAGLSNEEVVRRIQTGLSSAQVADLAADGIPGERTKAAIRTFEALEGMDVTGKADRRVLERLIEIGALH